MEKITFNDNDKLDLDRTKSKFIFKSNSCEPNYIYRFDDKVFELRTVALKMDKAAYILDIKEIQKSNNSSTDDAYFQFIKPFYIKDRLFFFIVVKPSDVFESIIYLLDNSTEKVSKCQFSQPFKGQVTNIFVSDELKNNDHGEYHIVTIGTLDSAIYIFRIASDTTLLNKHLDELRLFNFALLRTDARNAITQHIITCNHQSKPFVDNYLICGGFNGVLDVFLIKSVPDINSEPEVQFIRHKINKLPSNLPINYIQNVDVPNDEKHTLLIISQELKTLRARHSHEPSVTIIKLNKEKLVGQTQSSTKYNAGVHLLPVIKAHKGDYICRSFHIENKDQVIVADYKINFKKAEFSSKDKTIAVFQTEEGCSDIQHIAFNKDSTRCKLLTKSCLHLLTRQKKSGVKRKTS